MFVERAAEWVFLKQKVIYYIIFVTDVLEGAIQEFWGFSKNVYLDIELRELQTTWFLVKLICSQIF